VPIEYGAPGRHSAAVRYARQRIATTAIIAVALCSGAQAADTSSAIAGLAKQFDTHSVIMIGEQHKNRQIHAFLQQLLRNPAFICRANDIVVEFGNSRLQGLADAYESGAAVPETQLRAIWRETEVPLTWNSPVYAQFYATVRDINREHLCAHPIRVVLGGPPIDWSKIKTEKDFERFADRDRAFAQTVEREVLAKHHHALFVAGEMHALKQTPPPENNSADGPDAAQILERDHPGSVFCVIVLPTATTARAVGMGLPPNFKVVKRSALENADFAPVAPPWTLTQAQVNGHNVWVYGAGKNWPHIGAVVDGLIYLGGDETEVNPSPAIYLDPAYQKDLRHRAAIIKLYSGQDFNPVLDDLLKDARAERK
jgi:hypothetical protein